MPGSSLAVPGILCIVRREIYSDTLNDIHCTIFGQIYDWAGTGDCQIDDSREERNPQRHCSDVLLRV